MNKTREILSTTSGTEGALKKVTVVLLAIMLAVSFSPLGALPSYAESDYSALSTEPSDGLTTQPAQQRTTDVSADSMHAVSNASADDVVPAAEEPVSGEDTPLAESPAEDSIEDEDNPLALVPSPGYWSLVDVLAAIVSTIAALLLFAGAMRGEHENDREQERERALERRRNREEERKKRMPLSMLVIGIAVAVASVIAVLITQEFTYEMALFDAWSSLFIAGTVVNLVLVIVEWRRSHGHDDGSGANPASAAPAAA